MGKPFEAITALANRQAHILEPFRQYLAEYFEFVADEKGLSEKPLYARPLIGLKLDVNEGRNVLAVRPGWKKAKRQRTTDHPGIPGEFKPQDILLELVKELKVSLSPGVIKVTSSRWVNDNDMARHLATICKAADSLLRNPLATFGQQADRCVCCHRHLTDLTSRTRGIGPECVKWFSFFEQDNSIARKYRTKYRDVFAPFQISADAGDK